MHRFMGSLLLLLHSALYNTKPKQANPIVQFHCTTVFIHINNPGAMHFFKKRGGGGGGGGGGATITYKKKSTLESSGKG